MSTLSATVSTLADVVKTLQPDGSPAAVAELLSQTNPILEDMPWKEGNEMTGHRLTVRDSLPSASWRALNAGVSPSKATTAQMTETCAMLEAWGEVDKDVAELNGNTAAFRASQAMAHLEAMNQEFASTLFYGSSATAPTEFDGLATRYASPSGATGQNVIDAGSSDTDNMSIWLIGWGMNTVYGIYPKGAKGGIVHEDLGLQTIQDATAIGTARLRAYQDHWQWKCGIAVEDWRYAVRIGSIDSSVLVADPTGATTNLLNLMTKAVHRLPSMGGIRPAFYMPRTVAEMLDIQCQQKSNVYLTPGKEESMAKVRFRSIPIHTCDALTEAETAV
jgi:hypothetical protein